jgi:UDP-N-acetylmuramate dehydrogenase
MKIYENFPLKNHNTFGMNVSCQYFSEVESEDDIEQLLSDREFKSLPKLFIGSGSNILFTKDYDGLVISQISNTIRIVSEEDDYVFVSAKAGAVWHQLVLFCIERNLGGIENLSLIPGKVGAAPIQNIGAYGQELSDVFHSLSGIHLEDLRKETFGTKDCVFGYRSSIFKKELKNKFIITEVTLRLNKNPKLNTGYGTIEEELSKMKVDNITVKDVSNVVCKIRMSKLPDPSKIGNAGSFFKNPEISNQKFELLKKNYNDLTGYKISDQSVKIAAGWLIEQCGFKGKKFGNVGVHEKQALVIVNYGEGMPDEVLQLKNKIIDEVQSKFDIELEEEVNII